MSLGSIFRRIIITANQSSSYLKSRSLVYHDIHSDNSYTNMSTSLEVFIKHINIIREMGFDIVSEITKEEGQIQLTFDDGFLGIYDNIRVINELDVAAKSLEGVAMANYQNLNTLANDALLAIDVNTTSQEIFDEGIISGKFAEIKMAYAETLIAAGMASEDVEKVVANTQTYLAHRGIAVANVIKAFGAGTGLSDQDRKYATNIVGGTINMNTGAMKKLLEIERKGYMGLIKTHNKAVDKVVNRLKNTSAEDKAQTALDFYIELPADYVSKVNRQSMSSAGVLQFLPPKAPVAGPFPYMQP